MLQYDITTVHFRDLYGRLLWVEPMKHEFRLYQAGETILGVDGDYLVERVALAENTQHVNVSLIQEDIIITEPHL